MKPGIHWMVLACLAAGTVFAQVQVVRPVDIASGIAAGGIRVTYTPPFGGDSLKPFDGNQFNALEMVTTDTLSVLLQFDTPVVIEKAKVFFWHGATWWLETAQSLSDLTAKTGSYAKPVNGRSASFFKLDSAMFTSRTISVARLSAKNPSDSSIRLGEFSLEGIVTFVKYLVLPQPVKLIPGAILKMDVNLVDDKNRTYPNILKLPLLWGSSNPSAAMIDEDGIVTGVALGSTTISVRNSPNTLSGTAPCEVVADFRSKKVAPITIKVALVNQNPMLLPSYHRLNVEFGWRDPNALVAALIKHFREATDSVINFQIVEKIEANTLKKASDSGQIYFDYREMVKYYQFDEKRNKGEIDEVWVFSAPYLGMWESQLMGPNAFWWNSSPIKDGTALTKLLSVMGLNYERGVDQAFHSFGHRMESAVREAYQEAQGRSWDPISTNPTPWDLFTRYDKITPGLAHCGNIHFPPNGTSDYNYGNTTPVRSYAENWFRYPFLFSQSSIVSLPTWNYTGSEPLTEGTDHLGYLRWWYNHIPRYEGVKDGVLNNWWMYWLDYDAAVALAKSTPAVGVHDGAQVQLPELFGLHQNYPNPFNPSTTITFTTHEAATVSITVFDMLGREVATLVHERMEPGIHAVRWDASRNPSGIYFYRLRAGGTVQTKRMVLIK
ncbi:MAG: T9SS type A sorting domain-containing protein [Ignavibacteriales bacterium]|nr:T9SS type A sorting domain-containing protein [Ignavibacteriales bacterium]